MDGCIDKVMSSQPMQEFVIYRYRGSKGSSGVAERWKHWGGLSRHVW